MRLRLALGISLLLGALGCSTASTTPLGDDRFREQDFEGAISAYEEALKNRPDDSELKAKLGTAKRNASIVHQVKAESALEEGDLERAELEAAQAIDRDRDNAAAQAAARRVSAVRTEVRAELDKARVRLESKEHEKAYRGLESISKYRPSHPEIQILMQQAANEYAGELLDAARLMAKTGDWTKAHTLLEHAQEIAVRQPALESSLAAAQMDVRVLELLDQGLRLKSQNDLAGALNRFDSAVKLRPGSKEAAELYASTRHQVAVTYVARANDATEATQPLLAYVWLQKAMEAEPTATEVAEVKTAIARSAANALMTRAEEAAQKGLVGLEWLRVKQAQSIDPNFPEIDKQMRQADRKMERALRPTIFVTRFENASGQAGREIRLTSELYRQLQQISGNGRFATVLDESGARLRKGDAAPEIVVRGTLERFEIVHHPDVVRSEVKEYFAEVLLFDLFTGNNQTFQGNERRYYNYNVTMRKVTVIGRLVYEIYDVPNQGVLASGALDENFTKEDRIVQGNKQAGVPDESPQLPADSVLAEDLHNALRDRLMGTVQSELGWTGKKMYIQYQKAHELDDVDASISWGVLACRSLSACGRDPLDQDLEFILKKTGFSIKDEKVQIDYLR